MQTEPKIADYAYAEDRQMTNFSIPFGTTCIGKHAFYNCRSLEQITLPHGGIEIEDGAFKNCSRLSQIILLDGSGDCTCLKDILYDMNHEITVTVHYSNADCATLLFPHYEYEYIANEPARVFSEVGYGAGYIYQQCFYDSKIDYKRYDSIWDRACVSEDISVLARILFYRLHFDYALDTDAKEKYLTYWNTHPKELLAYYIGEQNLDALHYFFEETTVDEKTYTLAREIAISLEKPAVLSFLLDLQNKNRKASTSASKFAL